MALLDSSTPPPYLPRLGVASSRFDGLSYTAFAFSKLTLDFHRTNSYIGTVLAQTVVSVLSLVPPGSYALMETEETLTRKTTLVVRDNAPSLLQGSMTSYNLANFALSPIHISCTLYLWISLFLAKREAGENALWKSNAKEVLLGSSSSQSRPSWLGHLRNPSLRRRNVSQFRYFWTDYVPNILFRRVSPVESMRYACFRNFCALLFIIVIIIRAVTALAQAQDEFETRSRARSCYVPLINDLRVLVRHQGANAVDLNPQTGQGYDVGVQVATQRTGQYHQCTYELQNATPKGGNWFQVFNCGSQNNSYTDFGEVTYAITIRSTNGTTLDAVRLPSIWLADITDTFQDDQRNTVSSWEREDWGVEFQDTPGVGQPGFMSSVVPWLVPPWQMIGGKHLEGNVDLVKRRFITSSVFRDIVANLKPTYKTTSLFTITTIGTTLSPDNFTSSALLTPSGIPSLSYLNNPEDIIWSKQVGRELFLCAFVEDYRSSTIIDAIGSIGGLLAILQSVHILLFGRPLFWGFAGAKLVSPFGLFGSCHSRGFRRRLRERYHRQSTSGQADNPVEAFQMDAFLRDFVIDLGPADVEDNKDIESGSSREPKEPCPENGRDGSHEDGSHDLNDTILPVLHSGAGRCDSQGRTTPVGGIGSNQEP
ncbi:hypothetical protein FRC09_000446 [Ceratobasidium sp. 395]|nr:hypothetical protein FRC09_000446 [Ceratobasidium sp. 395]